MKPQKDKAAVEEVTRSQADYFYGRGSGGCFFFAELGGISKFEENKSFASIVKMFLLSF